MLCYIIASVQNMVNHHYQINLHLQQELYYGSTGTHTHTHMYVFCLIYAGHSFTCWFVSDATSLPVSIPIYIPKLSVLFYHFPFSRLLTVEAATCVRVDVMTCWQKHEKMFRCGLDGNQKRLRSPSLSPLGCTFPKGSTGSFSWWFFFSFDISTKYTLQNLWAANSKGKHILGII